MYMQIHNTNTILDIYFPYHDMLTTETIINIIKSCCDNYTIDPTLNNIKLIALIDLINSKQDNNVKPVHSRRHSR